MAIKEEGSFRSLLGILFTRSKICGSGTQGKAQGGMYNYKYFRYNKGGLPGA